MNNKKTYLPVNWIDGMKVNKDHFISSDHFNTNEIKKIYSSLITPFNYGLTMPDTENKNTFKIHIFIDNQSYIHVKVIHCVAITRGGSRIDIYENDYLKNELSASMPLIKLNQETINEYVIVLAVNRFERIPSGVPDTWETPPRLPYVLPGYHVSVHPVEEINSIVTPHSFIIGKLHMSDGKPEVDEDYIPACQAVYSHPKLAEFHTQLLKVLGQIEIDIVDILRGIANKKQSTTIAETVVAMSEAMLQFLSIHLVEFRNMGRYYPPVYMFETIAAFARTINNSINKQSTANREELYNYVQDWCNLKQGEFERLLLNTVELHYHHDDIQSAIVVLAPFINTISKIINTLSNLDFIGRKKDRQIFVKEQKEKPTNSFLVD